MNKVIIVIVGLLSIGFSYGQCDSEAIFAEQDDNAVCIEVIDNVRYVYSNNIPDHGEGTLNGGFTVSAQEDSWTMCAYPIQEGSFTQLYGDDSLNGCSSQQSYKFGVGANGVSYAPSSREYFEILDSETLEVTGEYNYDWNVEAVEALGMNNQGAHLNSKGEYHYHSIAGIYFTGSGNSALGIDGSSFSPIVAYAADGFPVYYKYAYSDANDSNSAIVSFDSGWELKNNGGVRPGDGVTEPNGNYDGYYVEDYEFNSLATELDECNGRFGITPDYPDGTYYYVLTDSWPYIPRCFAGTHVDESFLIGSASSCPESSSETSCSEATLSITNIELEDFLSIYPNPVVSYFKVVLPEQYKNYKVIVYNSKGKEVLMGENENRYNVSHLASGVYYVKIFIDTLEVMKKLVIHK